MLLTTDPGIIASETQQPPEAVDEPPCFTSHLPHPSTTVATVVAAGKEDEADLDQKLTIGLTANEVSSSTNITVTTMDNAGNCEWSQIEPIAEYYSAGEDAEVAGLTVGEEQNGNLQQTADRSSFAHRTKGGGTTMVATDCLMHEINAERGAFHNSKLCVV